MSDGKMKMYGGVEKWENKYSVQDDALRRYSERPLSILGAPTQARIRGDLITAFNVFSAGLDLGPSPFFIP